MRTLAAFVLAACLQPAHAAIDIVFRYDFDTSGFFGDAARKSVLDSAATAFENRLQDSLSAITPLAGSTYSLGFLHPGDGTSVSLADLPVAANEIVVYVGSRNLGGSLGFASTTSSANGSAALVENVFSRSQAGALLATPTDYGPWGGSIAFSSSTSWSFNASSPPAVGQSDFYSVAVHELGHLFGIGTAESWDAEASVAGFIGATSVAQFGGTVPLAPDIGHWAEGTLSTIAGLGSFEAALDPTLTTGTRKAFTDLDYAALTDIGWQVAAIPEPETWAMMLSALGVIALRGVRGRARRQLV